MKNTLLLFALVPLFLVAGCNHTVTPADLGVSEKSQVPKNLKLDRQGAWTAVSITKLDAAARIKEAEARLKEAEADKAQAEAIRGPAPQLVINDIAGLAIYREIQRDKTMADMAAQSARIAEAAIKALQPQQKDTALDLPQQPKGAVAEIIDSTGDAVTKVANTNTALAGTVGALVAGAKSGDKTTVTGDDNKLSGRDLSAPKTTTSIVETVNKEVN